MGGKFSKDWWFSHDYNKPYSPSRYNRLGATFALIAIIFLLFEFLSNIGECNFDKWKTSPDLCLILIGDKMGLNKNIQ